MTYTTKRICNVCGIEYIPLTKMQRFCSKKCYGINRNNTALANDRPFNHTSVKKICPICGVEYWEYKSKVRKTCSRKCASIFIRGENNPKYKEKIKKVCKNCGKELHVLECLKDRKNFCDRECWNEWYRQQNHPCYTGNPVVYCVKFNMKFRESIREFFNNTCVICGKANPKRKLSVHHIYYNKKACCQNDENGITFYMIDGNKFEVVGDPIKFATLCSTCHSKTNHDRTAWARILENIIITRYNGDSYFRKDDDRKGE